MLLKKKALIPTNPLFYYSVSHIHMNRESERGREGRDQHVNKTTLPQSLRDVAFVRVQAPSSYVAGLSLMILILIYPLSLRESSSKCFPSTDNSEVPLVILFLSVFSLSLSLSLHVVPVPLLYLYISFCFLVLFPFSLYLLPIFLFSTLFLFLSLSFYDFLVLYNFISFKLCLCLSFSLYLTHHLVLILNPLHRKPMFQFNLKTGQLTEQYH